MIKRKLGNTGMEVAPLAFGGNVFGWSADEATSFRLLDAFVDGGFNLIDTADVYSNWVEGNAGGESETIIGRWLRLRGNRHKVIIATKVGWPMTDTKKGLSRGYIRSCVEDSLRRLQVDHIDLYQSHVDDPTVPQEETLSAYADLIRAGKVRAIGASQFSATRLREALDLSDRAGLPAYQTLQPGYNLLDRAGYEAELEGLCRERNLGVITFASLARGFLTGKFRSEADLGKSVRAPWVGKLLNERGMRVLGALDEVAFRHGATPAKVALAWIMARPGVTAPIAGASTVEQLTELMDAVRLQLDRDSIDLLDRASA